MTNIEKELTESQEREINHLLLGKYHFYTEAVYHGALMGMLGLSSAITVSSIVKLLLPEGWGWCSILIALGCGAVAARVIVCLANRLSIKFIAQEMKWLRTMPGLCLDEKEGE